MTDHSMFAWRTGPGTDDFPAVTLHYNARRGADATWDDPADPHEFDILKVTSWCGICNAHLDITDTIDDAQMDAFQDLLNEHHDFDDTDYDDHDDLDF